MARSILLMAMLACSLVLANCTEAPPIPPGGETKGGETTLPGETGPPPETLERSAHAALPRQALAVFVHDGVSYSCTPEGSLYNKPIADIRSFALTAVDLASGKKKWSYKGSACAFRVAGDFLYVARYAGKEGGQLHFDRVRVETGEIVGSIKVEHTGCADIRKSGPGEKLFASSSSIPRSCYDFKVQDGKLLVTHDAAARLFDATSGKLLWEHKAQGNLGRVVTAFVHDGMAYVMEAVGELASDALTPPGNDDVKSTGLPHQLRAISLSGDETRWVVGPFQGPVIDAHISSRQGALIVQSMSSSQYYADIDEYSRRGWKGYVRYYSLQPSSGASNWKATEKLYFENAKYTKLKDKTVLPPITRLVAPIAMEGGLVVQVPGTLQQISVATGIATWGNGLLTNDKRMSHLHAISRTHLHMRSSEGKVTLLKLIPKKAPEVTRGNEIGSLLYAADAVAPDAGDKAQGPKKRLSAKGYCVKFDGTPVPMNQIKSNTRFFLPPAQHYYTPDSFFTAFCANYLIDVEAHDMTKQDGSSLWKSRALVPEAPVFYFVRSNTLYVLSDNGDWFMFRLR